MTPVDNLPCVLVKAAPETKWLIAYKSLTSRLASRGINVALFLTRVNACLFRPGFAALQPERPFPSPLAQAFQRVNAEIDRLVEDAYLRKAV